MEIYSKLKTFRQKFGTIKKGSVMILEFLKYLEVERNYSKNTILGYENDLERFLAYTKEKRINYLKITKEEIWEYLKYLEFFSFFPLVFKYTSPFFTVISPILCPWYLRS